MRDFTTPDVLGGENAYTATRSQVETYFDKTATTTWERLTSDAPVSRIRQTVRAGRDAMRAMMLSRLPLDLSGVRILDAGCGPGAGSIALAERGAHVVGVDISPELISIAKTRLPDALAHRVQFQAGDMTDPAHGRFDFVFAMDSLIYYDRAAIDAALSSFGTRSGGVVFTVAPKTPLLMAMWGAGRMFPKSDRSPRMEPHAATRLARDLPGDLRRIGRISRGFYISECLEYAP